MRGFYSLSPRAWRGDGLHRDREASQPDPYGPGAPGYRQRTRQTRTTLPNGLIRVDIGGPAASGDAQPVPAVAPEATEEAAKDILTVLQSTALPAFKPGLGRG